MNPNKWLKRTPPSVTPPAGAETQASCHPAATPLSHTVGRIGGSHWALEVRVGLGHRAIDCRPGVW